MYTNFILEWEFVRSNMSPFVPACLPRDSKGREGAWHGIGMALAWHFSASLPLAYFSLPLLTITSWVAKLVCSLTWLGKSLVRSLRSVTVTYQPEGELSHLSHDP